jgi:hypothetical protein
MNNINDFVVLTVAHNITKMSNEELQKLASLLSGSVGESLCDYLAFAIQDAQLYINKNVEMETI